MRLKELRTIKDVEDTKAKQLYEAYLKDLSLYSEDLKGKDLVKIASEEVTRCVLKKDTEFLIAYDEADVLVGFAIIGTFPNAYSQKDFYIQEFFIKEKRRGNGTKLFQALVNRYRRYLDDISFFVLEKNTPALKFWESVGKKYKDLAKLGFVTAPQLEDDRTDKFQFFYYTQR